MMRRNSLALIERSSDQTRCVSLFFSSRRRHTRFDCDWSSDVCSSDLSPRGAGKQTSGHGLAAFVLLSRLRGGNRPSGSGVAFDVVVVPGEVTLESVLDVRRRLEFVVFARVDDKFGGAAQPFERLIHLLAAEDGNVPVD